ncbi:ABC transporter permease, partial [Rhizobiaceae sp. 2RAB30]
FLMFPIALVVLLSFNSGEFLAFPLEGFSLRWFEALFSNTRFLDATLYSLRIAAISMLVNGVIGTIAAVYVARHAGAWRDQIRVVTT